MAEVVVELQSLLALQEKSDNSAGSSSIKGFTSKVYKHLGLSTKVNSDHGVTNSPKSREDNMNQCSNSNNKDGNDLHKTPRGCGEIVAGDLIKFTYGSLSQAIWGFGNEKYLGKGSYGKVYKGWVDKTTYSPSNRDTGLPIAVKRLHHSNFESLEKFELDLKLLREFSHPNLVKLIGYCLEGEEFFLVYEFVQNGSLENYMLNEHNFHWLQR